MPWVQFHNMRWLILSCGFKNINIAELAGEIDSVGEVIVA